MAAGCCRVSWKLPPKVDIGRCLLTILIFLVIIVSESQLDARVLKKEVRRDANDVLSQEDSTPPCRRNPIIGIPIDLQLSPNKINVALTYKASDFPHRPFSLMLFEGDHTLDCTNNKRIKCARHVEPWRQVNDTSSIYENLKPGYYCAILKYDRNDNLCQYASFTERVKDPSNETNAQVIIVSPSQDWMYIVLGVTVSAILLIAIVLLSVCRRPGKPFLPLPEMRLKRFHEAIQTKTPVPVVLLYTSDCSHHLNVVKKLAEFLEQNYCKVSCEYKEKHEIVVNKVSWIHSRLSGKFKILLVNSKMAYLKQHFWLKKKDLKETTLTDDLFLHALAIISHRIKQMLDYKNVFMLLPSYVSKEYVLSDICPGKQYEFPRYLAVLLCHLHDVESRTVDFEELGMSWEHCASAYDELLRLVNSMTAYDDLGNLITGCKQCDSQVISTKPIC